MSVRKSIALLSALVMVLFCYNVCYAYGEAELSQVYSQEQCMDIFLSGSMDLENLNAKIANRDAEILESGLLADKGVTVRTTVLVDISTSIPLKIREPIKDYMKKLISDMKSNEEIQFAVFGEEIVILNDFTDDVRKLDKAAESIGFDNSQSMIYDAVYNTIPKLTAVNDMPCYYRTIVITDGVDVSRTGITKEELLLKLQNDTYPINIIEVSDEKKDTANKDLASLARVSGGKYENFYPERNMDELFESFSAQDILWLRVILPADMLDGTTRHVNISDGAGSVEFDAKLPVFDVPVTETTAVATESETTAAATETTVSETVTSPVSEVTEDTKPKSKGNVAMIFIIAGVAAAALIAVIVVLIVMKKKRSGSDTSAESNSASTANSLNDVRTEYLSEEQMQNVIGSECIRMRNVSQSDQVWDFALNEDLIIGRGQNCRICIVESSVSREQCRITYKGGGVYIENLSHSNITQVNGEKLTGSAQLHIGDKIKCGRVILMVESLYTPMSNNSDNLNKLTEFVRI